MEGAQGQKAASERKRGITPFPAACQPNQEITRLHHFRQLGRAPPLIHAIITMSVAMQRRRLLVILYPTLQFP